MVKYTVKKTKVYHGICPPGYEKVRSHERNNSHVEEYCRRIKVQGRVKTLLSGMYNEGMIGEEDVVLGFDTIVDSTKSGEKYVGKIKERSNRIDALMKEQEDRKREAKEREDGHESKKESGTGRKKQ
jgi:hypothetical protein